jgi:gluconolactonase
MATIIPSMVHMLIYRAGGTNYKGNILYVGQGQGDAAPQIYIMNPVSPYNTSVLLNNFMGHQFNSLNDVAVNRKNVNVYFTDPNYAFIQGFRPAPGLPTQVYRFNDATGAVTVVADGFTEPNGPSKLPMKLVFTLFGV